MNQRAIIAAAAASLFCTGLLAQPVPAQAGKEKCYGIAKAGQNDCANLSGTHSCAGQTKASADPSDWKYVAKGTCKTLNGLDEAAAKGKIKKT